jgi:Tfp pilus assembly protein PilF
MLLSVLVVTLVSRHVPLVWLRVAMLGLVVLVWSVWTYDRNRVWASEEMLWRDCAAKAPYKARPHNNLGVLLARQGKLAEATVHFTTVLRLQPTFVTAHNNLGLLLAQQGKLAEATAHYVEALRLRPNYEAAHNNLGNALAQQGKLAEAITHYTKALQLQPAYAEAHYNLGLLLAQQGQRAEAIAALEAALRYRPDWPQAANSLAWLLATQEHPSPREVAEAVRLAEWACQATRDREAPMLDTLAVAYAAAGRMADAVQAAHRALAQAKATGQETLVRQIQERLIGYERASKP